MLLLNWAQYEEFRRVMRPTPVKNATYYGYGISAEEIARANGEAANLLQLANALEEEANKFVLKNRGSIQLVN